MFSAAFTAPDRWLDPARRQRNSNQKNRKAPNAPPNFPHTYSRSVRRVERRTSITPSSWSLITGRPAANARNQAPNINIALL